LIEQKIIHFQEKVISNKKTKEVVDVDSAVWYIEAALNYYYCEPKMVGEANLDSVYITLPINEKGKILFDAVSIAYLKFISSLNKRASIQLADVSVIETSKKQNEETFLLVIYEMEESEFIDPNVSQSGIFDINLR